MTAIVYRVRHQTTYRYQRNVTLSQQMLHMMPRSFVTQEILSNQLTIEPTPVDWINHLDYFGNPTRSFTLSVPHQQLCVLAESVVRLTPRASLAQIGPTQPWERQRAQLSRVHAGQDCTPFDFLYPSPHVVCLPELAEYARPSFLPGCDLLAACMSLTERIYNDFKFDSEATTISTPLLQVLHGRRGVCQDFAHLMLGCLRTLGLAGRYVSGYILTTPPPGQPRMVGADASHAWVAVYCDGVGWVDFDPTNRCVVGEKHITLGWGRDFSDVTPMRGLVLGGGVQKLQVAVTVERQT